MQFHDAGRTHEYNRNLLYQKHKLDLTKRSGPCEVALTGAQEL